MTVLGCVLAAVGFALWAGRATSLHSGSQVAYIVMSGAGLGFMLGQTNTDAINRASRYSYGEATGITQTDRNYGPAWASRSWVRSCCLSSGPPWRPR